MTIKINGKTRTVTNRLSSGPGEPPHTYELGRDYVYEIAGVWRLQRPGQCAAVVTVSEGSTNG